MSVLNPICNDWVEVMQILPAPIPIHLSILHAISSEIKQPLYLHAKKLEGTTNHKTIVDPFLLSLLINERRYITHFIER